MPDYKKRIKKWITALESRPEAQKFDLDVNFSDTGIEGCACTIGIHTIRPNIRKKYESYHYNPVFGRYVGVSDQDFAALFGISIEDTLKVIELNDEKRKSFKYIAKWIEKNLLPKAATR